MTHDEMRAEIADTIEELLPHYEICSAEDLRTEIAVAAADALLAAGYRRP